MGKWYYSFLAFGCVIENIEEAIENFYMNNNMDMNEDPNIDYKCWHFNQNLKSINEKLEESGYAFELVYGCPYYDCQNTEEITTALVWKDKDKKFMALSDVKKMLESPEYELLNNCLAEFDLEPEEPGFLSILHVC